MKINEKQSKSNWLLHYHAKTSSSTQGISKKQKKNKNKNIPFYFYFTDDDEEDDRAVKHPPKVEKDRFRKNVE